MRTGEWRHKYTVGFFRCPKCFEDCYNLLDEKCFNCSLKELLYPQKHKVIVMQKNHYITLTDRELEILKDVLEFELEMLADTDFEDYDHAQYKGYREAILDCIMDKLPKTTKEVAAIGLEK